MLKYSYFFVALVVYNVGGLGRWFSLVSSAAFLASDLSMRKPCQDEHPFTFTFTTLLCVFDVPIHCPSHVLVRQSAILALFGSLNHSFATRVSACRRCNFTARLPGYLNLFMQPALH